MDANPYASPATESAEADAAPNEADPPDFRQLAWQIIFAWERLRIGYLAWLAVWSVVVLTMLPALDPEIPAALLAELWFWFALFVGFVGANVCFTAAHVLELFVALCGLPRTPRLWLRGFVFIAGTLFATLLAAGFIVGVAEAG